MRVLLHPVSNSQAVDKTPIELPLGQPIILGRGPFLRITDQWVSRDQAEVFADERTIEITSLGKNNSCLKKKGSRDFKELRPDKPTKIGNGDTIALLPGGLYMFRIEIN